MAMKYQGMLCIVVGDEVMSVCPCQIDDHDGGVFAVHETDRKSDKKRVTWHRLGTIDAACLETVE